MGSTRAETAAGVRHLLGHLLMPLLMCVGMGLAYLGGFHHPEPNGLRVVVVGDQAATKVLAQTLKDTAGDALDVRTVPDRTAAVRELRADTVSGAYVPDRRHPELLVASAASGTTADAVKQVFGTVALRQGAPLTVTDVVAPARGDPTGQGLFFLLVAISIGSYTGVAAIGAAGARLRIGLRAAFGLGLSLVVSLLGALFAGPVFHLVDHDLPALWALGWLYSAGVLAIGIGLHTFLKRWTTLALMVLFVMLNFTTAGGVFRPELQPRFFGALHSFWNGAGFVEGLRALLYFDGHGAGGRILALVLWFVAGLAVLGVAAVAEHRRASRTPEVGFRAVPERSAGSDRAAAEDEEIEEAVPA